MNNTRRNVLKTSGALGTLVALGLITEKQALAQANRAGFEAKSLADALKSVGGTPATGEWSSLRPFPLKLSLDSGLPRGAVLCSNCQTYQDWRRWLPASPTILALLTALVSVLGVPDITQMGKVYASGSFRFFETYSIVAYVYLVLTIGLSILLRGFEQRMRTRMRD